MRIWKWQTSLKALTGLKTYYLLWRGSHKWSLRGTFVICPQKTCRWTLRAAHGSVLSQSPPSTLALHIYLIRDGGEMVMRPVFIHMQDYIAIAIQYITAFCHFPYMHRLTALSIWKQLQWFKGWNVTWYMNGGNSLYVLRLCERSGSELPVLLT